MKKSVLLLLVLALGLGSCATEEKIVWNSSPAEGVGPALIPLPSTLEWAPEIFEVPEGNIICHNASAATSAQWVEELLSAAGLNSEVKEGENCGSWNLQIKEELKSQLGEEGYLLEVTADGVTMQAATEAGLFYAIQSLRQLLPPAMEQANFGEGIALRGVKIEDIPHYSWRGTMVDVARSFFGIDYLKKHVDRMAAYKMNRLHLHLSDDQGWRIEIKGWPKLTEVGGDNSVKDGQSGFITQEEYKELQAYANARNIMVIPEIDMPGHIYAALRSYPEELNCPDFTNITPRKATPPEAYQGTNVGWSKFCLENPAIYDFVSDVIGEMVEITTGPYIHIGGDEISDPRYEEFVVKADSIVRGYGKTTIGWEEVTKAQVDTTLISQVWHGNVKSEVNVRTIQSLCTSFYLDHANVTGQEHTNNWCKKDGVSMENVYGFSTEDENALGVEAAVWTEFVIDEDRLDDRFWPRGIAVAEVGWTLPEKRDYEDFVNRLGQHASRLNAMGINYYETPGIEWNKVDRAPEAGTVFSGFLPENK